MGSRPRSGPRLPGGEAGGVPGAFARFWRDRLRVASVALLAVALLATAAVQTGTSAMLRQTVDAHWRGAYDILVTAKDSTVGDVLPPNSLTGSAGTRMSLDDVARVRDLSGVAIAAPIGEVVAPGGDPWRMEIVADVDQTKTTPDPQAYRLTVTYTTDDGLGARIISTRDYRLVLDDSNAPTDLGPMDVDNVGQCSINGVTFDCPQQAYRRTRTSAYFSASDASGWSGSTVVDGRITLNVGDQPTVPTRITLVDPVAERALLGTGSDFLQPLVDLHSSGPQTLDALAAWSAKQPDSSFTDSILSVKKLQDGYIEDFHASPEYQEYLHILVERGLQPPERDEGWETPFLPVMVSPTTDVPLSVKVDVTRLGSVPVPDEESWNIGWDTKLDTEPGTPVGTIRADAQRLLDPFDSTPFMLAWPGQAAPAQVPTQWFGGYTVLSSITSPTGTAWEPRGYLLDSTLSDYNPVNNLQLGKDGTFLGAQAAYSKAGDVVVGTAAGAGGAPAVVPVAAFDASKLDVAGDPLSYVPLGAYDPARTTLIADGHGSRTSPTELMPSAGGFGVVGARATTIADISTISALSQDPLVDAVRVRVADVGAYDSDGIRRVTATAAAIRRLGLNATVVAGSSPRTVQIAVGGYAFGTDDPTAKQRVGALGTVEQNWSELGAAARTADGVSLATGSLVGVVAASVLALFALLCLSGIRRRRADAALQRAAGWSRPRRTRWLLAESLPGVAVVVLAGLAAVAFAGDAVLTTRVVGGAILVTLAATIAAAVSGSRVIEHALATEDQLDERRSEIRVETSWDDSAEYWDGAEVADDESDDMDRAGMKRAKPHDRLRVGAQSVVGFGGRLARSDPGAALLRIAAVLIVMASAGSLALVLLTGTSAGGSSLLAQFARAQALAPHIVLGVVGVLAGLVIVVLLRAIELRRRADAHAIMRASGWIVAQIRRAESAEVLLSCVPALLAGAYLAWFALSPLHIDGLQIALAVAVAAGVLASVGILITRPKAAA